MLQQVQEDGVGRPAIRVQSVRVRAIHRAADDMTEKLLTKSLEEIVLRLEVRVEGRASDVGAVDDLLHRVDGDGKADALDAVRRNLRAVDADDLAVRIDERTARIAGTDRRIRLDER